MWFTVRWVSSMFEVLGSELLYFILRIISVEIIDRSHDRDREVRITHKKYFPYYHRKNRRGFLILGDRHPLCVLFTCWSVECHIVVYLYFGDNVTSTNLFIITISSIIIIIIYRLYFDLPWCLMLFSSSSLLSHSLFSDRS